MAERVDSADPLPAPKQDQALERAPRPPRTLRAITVAVMAMTVLACSWLAASLWAEARYALSPAAAIDVGGLADAKLTSAQANRYVRARVELDPSASVSFRRPFEGAKVRVSSAGNGRWVAYHVPDVLDGPRFVVPSLVAGRLVRLSALGPRYRGLRAALENSGQRSDGWLLVDGERPDSAGWITGIEALLLVFLAWNLWSLVTIVRRVPG